MFYSFIESGKYVAYLFSGQIPVGGKQIIRRESDLYSFRYKSGISANFIDRKLDESLDKLLEPFINEEICSTNNEPAGTIHDTPVHKLLAGSR